MSKHTPGPWVPRRWFDQAGMAWEQARDTEDEPLPPVLDIVAANGEIVAAAHDRFVFSEANAALIAAAPDLLEALEEFLADQETLNEPYRNEAVCERARAAIAKAKGW